MSHFSQHRHPSWKENQEKWKYAWDHYDGSYADSLLNSEKVSQYLQQKYQRENNKAFEERKKVSDVVLHFATIVDGINGVLATKEKDTVRDFGALAAYDEDGDMVVTSPAYNLLHNADGSGTNLSPLMKQVGIKQTVLHNIWGYVEGITDSSPHPHIEVIDPQHVVNWFPSKGQPTQVLVKEVKDVRTSITDNPENDGEVFTLFTLDGWKRFKVEDDVEQLIDEGDYAYYDSRDRKKRILPIFRTEIPMPRQVGYLLAKRENHIYNSISVRDFALRNLSFAILNVIVDSEDQYDKIKNALAKGANILPSYSDKGSHQFISPDSTFLNDFEAVIQNKIEEYYTNGFKKFGEAAKQATATEVKLENQSGIEAFLALLVSSQDEFENQCYKIIEQIEFPDDSSKWGLASVKRSRNFQAEDINEVFNKMATAILNAKRAGAISVHQMVERLNPTWDEDQVNDEVDRINKENGASLPDPFRGG